MSEDDRFDLKEAVHSLELMAFLNNDNPLVEKLIDRLKQIIERPKDATKILGLMGARGHKKSDIRASRGWAIGCGWLSAMDQNESREKITDHLMFLGAILGNESSECWRRWSKHQASGSSVIFELEGGLSCLPIHGVFEDKIVQKLIEQTNSCIYLWTLPFSYTYQWSAQKPEGWAPIDIEISEHADLLFEYHPEDEYD